MMTIGEFALHTGISVKALRFYDERRILPPAEVDSVNGYRFYLVGQLRDATTIRTLRAAGMSLETVGQVLGEPDQALELLARHQQHLQATRDFEDRAVRIAEESLADAEEPNSVQTRQLGPTHWVAAATTVRPDDAESDDAEPASRNFELLHTALQEAGNPPSGGSWTAISPTVGTGEVEVLYCFPVHQPVGRDFTIEGVELRQGTLPERTEAFVRIDLNDVEQDRLDESPGGPLPHPSYLSFVDYLDQQGYEPRHIRQGSVPDGDGTPVFLELSATVSPADNGPR